MAKQDLEEIVGAIVAAASRERHEVLTAKMGELRTEAAIRGMYPSSTLVNAVFQACAQALRDIASSIWEAVVRAHKSQGSSPKAELFNVFQRYLDVERAKIEDVQKQFVAPALQSLQNASLRPELMQDMYRQLLSQYEAEANVYLGNLKHGPGTNLFEILKHRFLNSGPIAMGAIVLAVVVAIAGLIDMLIKLSDVLRKAI